MSGMGGGTRIAGKVLDMGCGKGGDLTKWLKARIKEYFGVGSSFDGGFSLNSDIFENMSKVLIV